MIPLDMVIHNDNGEMAWYQMAEWGIFGYGAGVYEYNGDCEEWLSDECACDGDYAGNGEGDGSLCWDGNECAYKEITVVTRCSADYSKKENNEQYILYRCS